MKMSIRPYYLLTHRNQGTEGEKGNLKDKIYLSLRFDFIFIDYNAKDIEGRSQTTQVIINPLFLTMTDRQPAAAARHDLLPRHRSDRMLLYHQD